MQNQKILRIYDHFEKNRNLWIIVLLGFLIRVYAFNHIHVINSDSVFYIYQARAASENMWGAAKSCGYPFISIYPIFVILFHKVFSNWIFAAKTVSLFFGTLSIIPFYFLMKRFFSNLITGIVVLIFALTPFFVKESVEIMKDPVFWFFAISGLLIFVRAIDKTNNKLYLLSSLSFCLAGLARIEGLVLFAGSFLFLVFRKDRTIKNILFFCFPFILIGLITVSTFFISKDGQSLWSIYLLPRIQTLLNLNLFENPFHNNMTEKLKGLGSQQIESIPPNFFKYVKLTLWSVALGVLLTKIVPALYLPFSILFVIGLKDLKKEIRREPLTLYLIFLSIFSFVFLYIFTLKVWIMEKRYVATFIFPSFLFIGFGVQRIINFLKKKGFTSKFMVIIVCILIIAVTLPENLKHRRKDKLPYKEIGEFIASKEIDKKDTIVTSKVRVIFYANNFSSDLICPKPAFNYRTITQKPYSDLVALLKRKKFEYFLWEEDKWRDTSYDFLGQVNADDMIEVGQWEIKQNRLVLFKVINEE